jgi:hypothetical protein
MDEKEWIQKIHDLQSEKILFAITDIDGSFKR